MNEAWVGFGVGRGAGDVHWVGRNYFSNTCDPDSDQSDYTRIMADISDVVGGTSDESHAEYPCHSPTEERWFYVNARAVTSGNHRFTVISHHDVTDRYLAEQRALDLPPLDRCRRSNRW